jgi:pyruvate/2-oxoacid:ferredoxin oxidoreductase beta subunit
VAAWLDEVVTEKPLLLPGHAACAGCGPAINMRHVLGALAAADPAAKTVLVVPASCWTIIAGVWPISTFDVSVHLTPFASAAAEASALKAAFRLRGLGERTNVVVWAGDGSTCDIGFSGLSAAAERDEDVIYVLNDNEAYMNTGVQKSGATPEGAWTTTTPTGAPRAGRKKDIARIMAAHGIPYTATLAAGSLPMLKDFRAKVTRAAEIRGFRFLHVFGACPPGWRYPTDRSIDVVRLAVESRYFPLFACDHGEWAITFLPKREVPVADLLATQGRFAHLSAQQIEAFQAHVDERWELLVGLEAGRTPAAQQQLRPLEFAPGWRSRAKRSPSRR